MGKYILIAFSLLMLASPAAAQRSLYQDYKAQRIGDVVTIILKEDFRGASSTDAVNRAGRSGGAAGSVSGNITPFVPVFGANAKVDYQSDNKNQAAQSQLLQGTLSARIEDVTPSGDLLLFAERSMEINGEKHTITIKGYIRPNDVDAFNSVPSFRIANAEISYMKKGGLKNDRRKPGFGKTVAWVVLGVGLGAAAVVGVQR